MLKNHTNFNQQEQPHSNNKTNSTQRCQPVESKNKQLRYLNICVTNCCSIRNKLSYVLDHVKDHMSDIVAITKSWLSTEECNNRAVSHDYEFFHVPRPNRRGGGVALLIKNGLQVIKQTHSTRNSFERIELLVTAISIHLRIVVIYRPPQSMQNYLTKSQIIDEFNKYLEGLASSSGRLLICGDFKVNWLDTSDNICKKLLNTLESYNLHQHVTNSTHKSGHLLDYISYNQLVSSVLVSDYISDHCALHATIACTRDHPSRKKITYRCLKNIKSDELSKDLSNIDSRMECIDVNLVVDNYNTVLSSLLDSHAPLKTDYVTSRIL